MASDPDYPPGWELLPLGSVATLQSGFAFKSKEYKPNGVPVVRIGNVKEGGLNWDDTVFWAEENITPQIARFLLRSQDIVISMTGNVGVSCQVSESDIPALLNQRVGRFIVEDESRLDTAFLLYATSTTRFRDNVSGSAFGAIQQNVSGSKIEQIVIPLPPSSEQRAIAHVLRTVQRAKEATEKVIAAARQLKQSLMRHLFTYGPVPVEKADKVPLKETDIGQVPEHWRIQELGECATLSTGGTPSRDIPEYWNGTIPWVKTGEIDYRVISSTEEFITEEGLENSNARNFPPGTMLVAMYGQGVTRGRVAFLGIEATTNQACAALFPKPCLDKHFLYYSFVFGYERIREMGHGANQRNLSMTMLKSVKLALPPVEGQRLIAAQLTPIDKKIDGEEKKRYALDSLFNSLLQHLMTGKVRVNHLKLPT